MKYFLLPFILLITACGGSATKSLYKESGQHFDIVDARAKKLEIAKKDSTDQVYNPNKQETVPLQNNNYTMIYSVDIQLADITNIEFTNLWVKPYDALSVYTLKKNNDMINVPTAPGETIIVQAKFRKGRTFSGDNTTVLGAPAPFEYEGEGLLEYKINGTSHYATITDFSGI